MSLGGILYLLKEFWKQTPELCTITFKLLISVNIGFLLQSSFQILVIVIYLSDSQFSMADYPNFC